MQAKDAIEMVRQKKEKKWQEFGLQSDTFIFLVYIFEVAVASRFIFVDT